MKIDRITLTADVYDRRANAIEIRLTTHVFKDNGDRESLSGRRVIPADDAESYYGHIMNLLTIDMKHALRKVGHEAADT